MKLTRVIFRSTFIAIISVSSAFGQSLLQLPTGVNSTQTSDELNPTDSNCPFTLDDCGNGTECFVAKNLVSYPIFLNGNQEYINGIPQYSDQAEKIDDCKHTYIQNVLNNSNNAAVTDPFVAALEHIEMGSKGSQDSAMYVFTVIFDNTSNTPETDSIIYLGSDIPLYPKPDGPEFPIFTALMSQSEQNTFFNFLSQHNTGLEESTPMTVPANSIATISISPRDITNPQPGFYVAAAFAITQKNNYYLDQSLMLNATLFRRVNSTNTDAPMFPPAYVPAYIPPGRLSPLSPIQPGVRSYAWPTP